MKILPLIILCPFLFLPLAAYAEAAIPGDTIFQARVIEVLAEEKKEISGPGTAVQQHLRLRGLEGEFRDQEIEFNGLGGLEVVNNRQYSVGDRVLLAASYDETGQARFYVVDYVRTFPLALMAAAFILALLIVGRFKGLRALLALALSFFVIIKYIVPQILSGASPLIATLLGSLVILAGMIYLTEGWRPRAHLSVLTLSISLILTIFISWLFLTIVRLSGGGSEDVLFLFSLEGYTVNLQGLLLSGIIIGALGVLDDVVISQVAAVEEIAGANPGLRFRALFRRAYSIGVSHIASMTNTLFLAYAGASLPLLILFAAGQSAFTSLAQALNTELIATEIVRTLSGSLGLVLSVPLATLIAARYFARRAPRA